MNPYFGLPIYESPLLPAERGLLLADRLIVGDIAAFRYRLRLEEIKAAMRADLQRALDAFAARWGIQR